MKIWTRTIAALIASVLLGTMSQAAELTILASQGNLPGLNALAAAFGKASGHKVTVLQPVGKELEEKLSSGPADLMAANPPTIEGQAKKGRLVAGSITPYMLAGL